MARSTSVKASWSPSSARGRHDSISASSRELTSARRLSSCVALASLISCLSLAIHVALRGALGYADLLGNVRQRHAFNAHGEHAFAARAASRLLLLESGARGP